MTKAQKIGAAALVIAATTATTATVARAEESADPAAAEALFQQGREAMDRKDLDAACSACPESNRLDPGPGTGPSEGAHVGRTNG